MGLFRFFCKFSIQSKWLPASKRQKPQARMPRHQRRGKWKSLVFSKSEVWISPTKSSPGNSSCDLFGDDYISDPVKGCWWPPTKESTGHFESNGEDHFLLKFRIPSRFFCKHVHHWRGVAGCRTRVRVLVRIFRKQVFHFPGGDENLVVFRSRNQCCNVKIGRESEIIWRSQTVEPKASSSSSANECCGLPILGEMDGCNGELIDRWYNSKTGSEGKKESWQRLANWTLKNVYSEYRWDFITIGALLLSSLLKSKMFFFLGWFKALPLWKMLVSWNKYPQNGCFLVAGTPTRLIVLIWLQGLQLHEGAEWVVQN